MLDDMLIMRIRVLIPIRGKTFLLFYKVGPSRLLFTGYQGLRSRLFFKKIKRPERRADLHLVTQLRMSGAVFPFPHLSSCCAQGNLYLYHTPVYEVIYTGVNHVCIFIKTCCIRPFLIHIWHKDTEDIQRGQQRHAVGALYPYTHESNVANSNFLTNSESRPNIKGMFWFVLGMTRGCTNDNMSYPEFRYGKLISDTNVSIERANCAAVLEENKVTVHVVMIMRV